jgi:hypothetical protein
MTQLADKSGYGHVPTANGNAVVSQSQYKFLNASVAFDGDGDYVSYPNSEKFHLSTSKFTIDFWLYLNSTSDFAICGQSEGSGNNLKWGLYYGEISEGKFSWHQQNPAGSVSNVEWDWTPSTGQWYHLALVRIYSSWYFYVNGISQGVQTSSLVVPSVSSDFRLGCDGDSSIYLNGYIDEFRINRGRAFWRGENFLVPSSPHPGIDNYTVLVIRGDGTNGSNTFKDGSPSQHTITANGDAQISTAQYKFGGSSIYFNGTSAYCTIPSNSDWHFENNNWTVDFWTYLYDNDRDIFFVGNYSGNENDNNGWMIIYDNLTKEIGVYWTTTGMDWSGNAYKKSISLPKNEWVHLAIVRNGSTIIIFKNGILLGSSTSIGSKTIYNSSRQLFIGKNDAYWGNGYLYLYGFIDELRISKGIARWTDTFTPPTQSYPPRFSPTRIDDYTVLLLHGEGANTSQTIYDYGKTNHTVTANGNAQISTAQYKFGGSSLYFDGDGDYLTIPNSSDFDFGSGSFTIELWFRTSGTISNARGLLGIFDTPGQNGWNLHIVSETRRIAFAENGPSIVIQSNADFTDNVFNHIALVSNGSNVYMFQNGNLVGSVVAGTYTGASGQPLVIGRYYANYDGYYFDGYIDEVRISKGIARWIEEFTPPTQAYP